MVDFIIRYWVEELFALIIMILTWLIHRVKGEKNQYHMLKEGLRAILHDNLYQACSTYLARGYCSIDDRENLEEMYKPYKNLNGNGTAEHLYHKCQELPLEPEEKRGENSVPQKKKAEYLQ